MRFRAGLVAGFVAGFYFGSWAGRERFHQINAALRATLRDGAIGTAGGKAKAVVDLGVERARDIVGSKFGPDRALVPNEPIGAGLPIHTPTGANGDSANGGVAHN